MCVSRCQQETLVKQQLERVRHAYKKPPNDAIRNPLYDIVCTFIYQLAAPSLPRWGYSVLSSGLRPSSAARARTPDFFLARAARAHPLLLFA